MFRTRKIEEIIMTSKNQYEKLPSSSFFLHPFKVRLLFLLILFSVSKGIAQANLDSIVDVWHKSAASANLEDYFGVMDEHFIFLGTAPGERWSKEQFYAFSKPYFDKGKAWDFKPYNRKWNFSKDSTIAWFDEDLDTWMRGCRGSGILINEQNQWKIVYYNLTVLIENEKMNSFIELRDRK